MWSYRIPIFAYNQIYILMKRITLAGCIMVLTVSCFAQKNLKDTINEKEQQVSEVQNDNQNLNQFKVSGYIQAQIQSGSKDATLRVGNKNTDPDHRFNRFGIRRGRVKLTYTKNIVSGVFQLDITERAISLKDAYISIQDPHWGIYSIRAGVFNRPFGYEVAYSSSRRESPERALVNTILFPNERDLGAMLTLQGPKASMWNFFKLEAAIIAGNSIRIDMDNRKDFLGRVSFNKAFGEKINLSGGLSYYLGGVYQGSYNVYTMKGRSFLLSHDTTNLGAFTKREYCGVDLQFEATTRLGMTRLYGEFLTGVQPGDEQDSQSPNYSKLPTTDTYIRPFRGGYITFVQDVGHMPLAVIVKYDIYDPNTDVADNDIGLNGTGTGDVAFENIGCGLMWHIRDDLKLTGYYDHIINEKTSNLNAYVQDMEDDVFTLRLQYKF